MTTHDAPAATSPTMPPPPAATHANELLPLALPARLFVPLPTRHGSAACLAAGTCVARGQALSDSTAGAAHVPLAPAAGTIVGVREVEVLGLPGRWPAAEIDVDAAGRVDTSADAKSPAAEGAAPVDLAALIDRLRLAGVRADRRTSPDLLAQLHDALRRPIDTVICSLLDPTAESCLSASVMRWAGRDVIAGVAAVARATGANRTWIAADPRLSDRVGVLLRKAPPTARMRAIELSNDYPQADPTMLLYALLGRRLRPDRLPSEVNTLLLDAPAAAAIGRALGSATAFPGASGSSDQGHAPEPMLTVPIELRDAGRARCTVFTAAVGTPLRHVLEVAGLKTQGLTFRAGAALRDVKVSCDAIIDGGELTVDAGPITPPINPDPCIRCGWCVESCPVRIHPAGLLEAAQDNDASLAERYGLAACIECGICSYVCPSRLPLLEAIRDLRKRTLPTAL